MHGAAWVLIPLAALLWRVRGGLLNAIVGHPNPGGLNDTAVRAIFSAGLAIAYGLLAGWHWHAAALAAGLFAACTVFGWYGASLCPTRWHDIGLLSLSGLLRMSFVALALLSPWPLVAGILCGPIYWLGSKIPQTPGGWDFWQEWLFGAAIGLSLAAAIWWPS
jgi:hypothetical protein